MNPKGTKLLQEKEADRARHDAARRRQAEDEQQRPGREAEAAAARRRVEETTLLPDGAGGRVAAATQVPPRVTTATAASEEAAQRSAAAFTEWLHPEIRTVTAREEEATHKMVPDLERFGRAILEAARPLFRAEVQRRKGRAELDELLAHLEGALGHTQRREVEGYLERATGTVSPLAALAWFVLETLRWTTAGSSPCESVWREAGFEIDPSKFSVFDTAPFNEGDLHALRAKQLPRR